MTAYPWEQNVHTYYVIHNMVWQLYWIFPKTPEKIFFSRMAGQIEGKHHTNVPKSLGIPEYS